MDIAQTATVQSMSDTSDAEKAPQRDLHVKLAEEVYGTGAISGEVSKYTTWGLKIRGLVSKFGGEEGGIERVPTEMRTDQHPRDLFFLFSSGNCCVTTFALGALGPGLFELGWWDSYDPGGELQVLMVDFVRYCFLC
jgi:hypothetical protein